MIRNRPPSLKSMAVAMAIGALMACATMAATGPQAVLAWTGPTLNTDGSAITGAITYNVYQGATGAETLAQSGLSTATATVTSGLTVGSNVCFVVTAVVAGVESARSNEGCKLITAPQPNAPTTIIITFTP